MRLFIKTTYRVLVAALFFVSAVSFVQARGSVACPPGVDPTKSQPLIPATATSSCTTKSINGFPVPDASCTPGAINPTVTIDVLRSDSFKTGCERDKASSAGAKAGTYDAYGIEHPKNNKGANQVCELDHLISLEIGGADTLNNIWPQCGPDGVTLRERYFKIKDSVENYLAAEVRSGDMNLDDAQRGIAKDWTQYIDKAKVYWATHQTRGFGRDD